MVGVGDAASSEVEGGKLGAYVLLDPTSSGSERLHSTKLGTSTCHIPRVESRNTPIRVSLLQVLGGLVEFPELRRADIPEARATLQWRVEGSRRIFHGDYLRPMKGLSETSTCGIVKSFVRMVASARLSA